MRSDPAIRRALVIYESMFGNTEAIARAIADGLAVHLDTVDVIDVTSAPTELNGVDLVVVGGPTHALTMSRAQTRASARDQGAAGPGDVGVREWLARLSRPDHTVRAACFDTRVRMPVLVGSAARAMRRRLRRLGLEVVATERFTVTGTPGPLAHGELDRARAWGAGLVPAPAPTGTGAT
jgi:hypothetical protein